MAEGAAAARAQAARPPPPRGATLQLHDVKDAVVAHARGALGGALACVKTLEGHGDRVWSVCFSPDGNQVASGGADKMVRLWDAETGACVKTLEGHGDFVQPVCFSPDGLWLAAGCLDNTVRLWLPA